MANRSTARRIPMMRMGTSYRNMHTHGSTVTHYIVNNTFDERGNLLTQITDNEGDGVSDSAMPGRMILMTKWSATSKITMRMGRRKPFIPTPITTMTEDFPSPLMWSTPEMV